MPSPFIIGVLLLAGFGLTSASTFTAAFSRRWGTRPGQWVTLLLRVGLGMPLWILGLVLAARAPGQALLPDHPAVKLTAGLLLGAGAGVILWAMPAVGRRALAPSAADTLVVRGPYAYVRHPVYSGCFLEFVGLALTQPTWLFILSCAACSLWLLLQARLEERDLLERLPRYSEYMRRVPRFVPRASRRAGSSKIN